MIDSMKAFLIATGLALVLLAAAPRPAAAAEDVGTAARVVNQVTTESFGQPVRTGDGLVANETVITKAKSAVDIRLLDQSTVLIGENSHLVLDEMVYARDQNKVQGTFRMLSGAIHVATAGVPMEFSFKTPFATIGIRGTQFDLLVSKDGTEVKVIEGIVLVQSPFGTANVNPGQVYLVTSRQGAFQQVQSPQMQQAIQYLLAMIAAPGGSVPTGTSVQQVSLPANLSRYDKDNLLVMEVPAGKVYIELLPDLAPVHVRRIKQLVRQQFYDGLAFHYVRQDYVAETGDPSYAPGATAGGGTGTTLPAEFSSEVFDEGAIGMSHKQNDPNSADSRFFIALGPTARSLDGKYTVWGRVVMGLQYLKALKAAKNPKNPERIGTVRVVSDLYK